MNPDDLARILDELGQRLGPSGEYVFALAVRQVVISSTLWLVISAVLALLSLVTLGACVAAVVRHKNDSSDPFSFGLIAFVGLFGSVATAASCIVPLLNPEYAALRDILAAIAP